MMRTHIKDIQDVLFKRNGMVYVCGATNLGKGVDAMISKAAERQALGDKTKQEALIRNLRAEGRYLTEYWGYK
jgi:sulfite reductase alpha subunit-like flavoprotein